MFFEIIIACLSLVFCVFYLLILKCLWDVLGLLKSVLENFLARHGKFWDALDAIRKQRDNIS